MMFMDDAIRATLQLMQANSDQITVRSSYNLAAMSFTPADIIRSIKERIPQFEVDYEPDFRQAIADSWPESIDDSQAQKDWGWSAEYDLQRTTTEMLDQLGKK